MGKFFALCVLLAAAALVVMLRRWQIRRLAAVRWEAVDLGAPPDASMQLPASVRPRRRRHPLLVALGALLCGLALWLFGLSWAFVLSLSLVAAILLAQLDEFLAARRDARLETQLIDAIDLSVGALGAGATLLSALEAATRESKAPLRPYLQEVIGRIQLGDDPALVFRALSQRVPLETFMLFSSTLSTNWEVGGSLATLLSGVGRTIRDRIEIGRRIRSNSTQSQVSTVAVVLLTYFIALVMWRTNPDQMRTFVATSVGETMIAGTIVLQAVGILWMSAISRVRF